MERFVCRALVLSTVDYGESDRVVSLFTLERGRVTAFAHGARRSRRRFAGALEPFTLLSASLFEGRGELLRLEGAQVLDGFSGLREDLGRASRAAVGCELARDLCREREPHPALFGDLERLLTLLAAGRAGPSHLLHFELLALASAGLMPRLDRCARCGAPPADVFDAGHGGLLCERCAGPQAPRISGAAARALASLQRAEPDGELDARVRAEAQALLSRFIAHHLGHGLKSLSFLREVGVE